MFLSLFLFSSYVLVSFCVSYYNFLLLHLRTLHRLLTHTLAQSNPRNSHNSIGFTKEKCSFDTTISGLCVFGEFFVVLVVWFVEESERSVRFSKRASSNDANERMRDAKCHSEQKMLNNKSRASPQIRIVIYNESKWNAEKENKIHKSLNSHQWLRAATDLRSFNLVCFVSPVILKQFLRSIRFIFHNFAVILSNSVEISNQILFFCPKFKKFWLWKSSTSRESPTWIGGFYPGTGMQPKHTAKTKLCNFHRSSSFPEQKLKIFVVYIR